MKFTAVFSVFVILMVFFSGCLGPAEEAPPTDVTPPSDEVPEEVPEEEQPPAEEQDVTLLTCEQVFALGIPSRCTMTVDVEGETSTTVLYFTDDPTEMRVEYFTYSPNCVGDMVGIFKENKMYMGCKEGKYGESTCDWIVMEDVELEEPADTTGMGPSAGIYDVSGVSLAQCSCNPWLYDASLFDASGKVCTFDDLIAESFPEDFEYPD